MKVVAAVVVILSLAACAPQYRYKATGEPSAQLTFVKSAVPGVMFPGQLFYIHDNKECVQKQGSSGLATSFHSLNGSEPATVEVASGKPTYLRALTLGQVGLRSTANGNEALQANCTNLVRFVPEAGHNYKVLHSVTESSCKLVVTDQATASAPSDLLEEPLSGQCS